MSETIVATPSDCTAASSDDWKALAEAAAERWRRPRGGHTLSECAGGAYYEAVRRGFVGHQGEWFAAVKQAAGR